MSDTTNTLSNAFTDAYQFAQKGAKTFINTVKGALPNDASSDRFSPDIIYPSDLLNVSGNAYYMQIKFEKYQKRSTTDNGVLLPVGGARLPIPANLRDTLSVNYDTHGMGPALGAAAEAILNAGGVNSSSLISNLSKNIQNINGVESVATALTDNAGKVGGVAAKTAAGAFAGVVNNSFLGNTISSLTGIAVNPFLSVLFKAPNFKTHSFSWRFTPSSVEESNKAKDIIQMFKYHMLPNLDQTSAILFTYPDIAIIKLYPSDSYLYTFKPCVVTSVTANFAPGSSPSFFKGTNAPTAIDFAIELLEIEYWTKNDYK